MELRRCLTPNHRIQHWRAFPELDDGRLLLVEYKGGDRMSNDDSREKRDIGLVWAKLSQGKCIFLMATDTKTASRSVTEQIQNAIK